MICYSIQILDSILIPSEHKDQNGHIYLDTYPDQNIVEKKSRAQLDTNNKIKIDGALDIEIPQSVKNNLILKDKVGLHLKEEINIPFNICVWQGAIPLSYNHMIAVSQNDENKAYTISLQNQYDHPLTLASNFKLCDIPYIEHTFTFNGVTKPIGDKPIEFDLSPVHIKDRQETHYKYEDAHEGWFVPYAWYGGTYGQGQLCGEDLRPFINPIWLFQHGFKQLNWTFKSTLLDSDKWRSAWMYLSDDRYGGNNIEELQKYEILGQKSDVAIADIQGSFGPFTLDVIKAGSLSQPYYDGTHIGILINERVITQQVTLEYKFETNTDENEEIEIILSHGSEQIATGNITIEQGERIYSGQLDAIAKDHFIQSGDNNLISARITKGATTTKIKYLKLYNKPTRRTFQAIHGLFSEESIAFFTYPLAETLSCDLSLLDVLKGILHLTGGLLEYDFARQIIYHYTPKEYQQAAEIRDITKNIICDSGVINTRKESQPRYLAYGFKRSSDAYIRSLDGDGQDQLFDKKIDLGEQFENKKAYRRNPLFEPTALRNCPEIVRTEAQLPYPPALPALTDNTDGEISYNIGPRILFASPPGVQIHYDDEGKEIGSSKINWCDAEEINKFPTLYQEIPDNLKITPSFPYEPLIYGTHKKDLWNLYLGQQVLQEEKGQHLTLQLHFNKSEYDKISLRDAFTGQYKSEYIQAFIKDISYNRCTEIAEAILQTIEDGEAIEQETYEIIPPDQKCNNKPKLTYNEANNIYTINVAGLLNSNIKEVTWKANHNGTNSTPTSLQIVDPTKNIEVRARVKWTDDCPDSILTLSIPVCNNNPIVKVNDFVNTAGQVCVNIAIEGIINSAVASITTEIEYNKKRESYAINPNTLIGHDICGVVTPFTINSLTINYQGTCEAFMIKDRITLINLEKRANPDCSQTTAGVQIVDGSTGFKTIQRTGNIAATDYLDRIWVQIDGQEPKIWDGAEIADTTQFKALREIIFCDGKCPVHRSCWEYHITDCDCPSITAAELYIECEGNTLKPVWSGLNCALPSDATYAWKNVLNTVVSTDKEFTDPDSGVYTLQITVPSISCSKTSEASFDYVKPEAGEGQDISVVEEDLG